MSPVTRAMSAKRTRSSPRLRNRKEIGNIKQEPAKSKDLTRRTLRCSVASVSKTGSKHAKTSSLLSRRISFKAPRAPPPTHYTCRICIEEQPKDNFVYHVKGYVSPIPAQCLKHLAYKSRRSKHAVCRSCIGRSMVARHELAGARLVGQGCLEPGCKTVWNDRQIKHFFPAECWDKYSDDLTQQFIASRIIRCINSSCSAQGFSDAFITPGYPHVECHSPTCKTHFCVNCKVPWHAGLTCTEYAAHNIESLLTSPEKETLQELQTRDARRCPNCQIVIEKAGGCHWMVCSACRTNFAWIEAASVVTGVRKPLSMARFYYQSRFHAKDGSIICELDALRGDL